MRTIYKAQDRLGTFLVVTENDGQVLVEPHDLSCRVGDRGWLSPSEARLLGEALVAWAKKAEAK